MIRRPIKPALGIGLGVLSVLLMLAGYTWLAHRQHQRNPDDTTIPRWGDLKKGLLSTIEVRWRGSAPFSEDEPADLPALAARLLSPSRTVDSWLAGKLSPGSKDTLASAQRDQPKPGPLPPPLLDDLNELVRAASIHEPQRFDGIALRPLTRRLIAQPPERGSRARLNRLLLEDAYPKVLPRMQYDRWLLLDLGASGQRYFLGLLGGVGAALVLGLLMGCLTSVQSFLMPPLSLLAKVPPTAALAVFFVLVGTGNNMYIAMIAFGVLPTMAMTVYLAVKEFPDELLFKAYTLGASQMEIVWSIIFRQILPKFIDAIRLSIGPAMVYLIAAEMVVGDVGFGYRIRLQSKLLNMSVVYPYLALLAGFGFGMDYLLRRLQRRLCPWYEPGP